MTSRNGLPHVPIQPGNTGTKELISVLTGRGDQHDEETGMRPGRSREEAACDAALQTFLPLPLRERAGVRGARGSRRSLTLLRRLRHGVERKRPWIPAKNLRE